MRVCTHYQWNTGKCCTPMRVMVVSDLHNTAYEDLLPMLEGVDALLVAGDTADRYRQRYERGIQFLKEAEKFCFNSCSLDVVKERKKLIKTKMKKQKSKKKKETK